jgi:hypothetical protein
MNDRVAEMQNIIGKSLVSAYSNFDWKVITLFYGKVGQIAEDNSECVDVNRDIQYASIPKLARNALEVLKEASATPDHGTWLSVDVTIVRDTGQFNIKYNYDEKPAWDIEPQPENYLLDLERYPRPADEIPVWYPKPEDYPNWHDELKK